MSGPGIKPDICTVSDLALRDVGLTRVRVTVEGKDPAAFEGYLDEISVVDLELHRSLGGARVHRELTARLNIGGAYIEVPESTEVEILDDTRPMSAVDRVWMVVGELTARDKPEVSIELLRNVLNGAVMDARGPAPDARRPADT